MNQPCLNKGGTGLLVPLERGFSGALWAGFPRTYKRNKTGGFKPISLLTRDVYTR
jgi:hypothetical protein